MLVDGTGSHNGKRCRRKFRQEQWNDICATHQDVSSIAFIYQFGIFVLASFILFTIEFNAKYIALMMVGDDNVIKFCYWRKKLVNK